MIKITYKFGRNRVSINTETTQEADRFLEFLHKFGIEIVSVSYMLFETPIQRSKT